MTDVVVIGGGPAGTSAAIRLARTGRRVRLYEKKRFPRPKLCGGFLSAEGLHDLAELDALIPLRRAGAVPVERTVLVSRFGTEVESALPSSALSISREVLDTLLLRQAQKQGVDVRMEDGFKGVDPEALTVIAAGRSAGLSQQFFPKPGAFGIQALFEGVEGVSDQVELDLVKNGYVGLARREGGRVNICALTTQERIRHLGPSLDHVLASFTNENPVLRAHLRGARRVTEWLAVGPVRLGVRQLSAPNTFYVGDAACVVDPFAGEGMSMGLHASRLLVRALDKTRQSPERTYEALWRKTFLPALRWSAALRSLYTIPVLPELALKALQVFPEGLSALTALTRYRPTEPA